MNEKIDKNKTLAHEHGQPSKLIKMSTIAYGAMAFVGFEICWWYHRNIAALLGPVTYDYKLVAVMIVSSILFLCFGQLLLELQFANYRKLKSTLRSMFEGVGVWGGLWLALSSSVAEELLFRGAIQPFLGVWLTSAIFGLLHIDPEQGISTWTLWAVLSGLILGNVVVVTGSLWPAIAIHFIINLIGILGFIITRKSSKTSI